MADYPSPAEGFNPGDDGGGYIRIIDGHKPWAGGSEGSNVHAAGRGGEFGDDDGVLTEDDRIGLPTEDC